MSTEGNCQECQKPFKPEQSIADDICDECRMKMAPCLECGATDEYQAGEICRCGGDKDDCHGVRLWG
jgi:hypothetical protein